METGLAGRRAAIATPTVSLGLACARALVAEGARIAICGPSEIELHAGLHDLGPAVTALRVDVSSPDAAQAFVQQAADRLGGLDILIVGGSKPLMGTFTDTPLEDYEAALQRDLLSIVAMCRTALPTMHAQRWGRIVVITSAGHKVIPEFIVANATADATHGLLEILALESVVDGVTVNGVQLSLDLNDGTIPGVLLDDFGTVVAFVCSAQARLITGAMIPIGSDADVGLS